MRPAPSSFSSLTWNPKKPEIAAIDMGGNWYIVSNIPEAKAKAKSDAAQEKTDDFGDEEMLNDDEVRALYDEF